VHEGAKGSGMDLSVPIPLCQYRMSGVLKATPSSALGPYARDNLPVAGAQVEDCRSGLATIYDLGMWPGPEWLGV
jgi:hypothetical protein